jgi:hypothetical protein
MALPPEEIALSYTVLSQSAADTLEPMGRPRRRRPPVTERGTIRGPAIGERAT